MAFGIVAALGWLGQRGTAAVAASALIGMTVPSLSELARPWLTEAIFVLLVLAFLRVDPIAVRARLRQPKRLLFAVIWMMLVVPICAGLIARVFGLAELSPDLMLALFIVTAAPSVMSAPAFIYLMGLDGALSLTLLVAAVIVTPLTAPFVGTLMLGAHLPLEAWSLAVKLMLLLGGATALAYGIRRVVGPARIDSLKTQIDGTNVLVLLFFAVAVMDGVAASFASRPFVSLAILVLTFAVALGQIGLTMLVFRPLGWVDAFIIGHSVGNRNMGLMVAALGGTLPDLAWLYFGLGQLPIYMLPAMLAPAARWLQRRGPPETATESS